MSIAVYGATGRTGRLVVDHLLRAGSEVVAGGRDAARLEAVEGVAARRVASPRDPRSLERLLHGCDVVVNCAGPQPDVVQAAVGAGVDVADAAGSQAYIRALLDRFGGAAGPRVVPALGFDYAIGDCLARLAGEGRGPLSEVIVAYAIRGGGTTGDALRDEGGPEVVFAGGTWRPPEEGVRRPAFTFPAPLGRQVMLRYGAGEAVTVPRHTPTRSVVTLITASTWAPHPALTRAMPYLRPLGAAARRSAALRGALAAAGRLAFRRGEAPAASGAAPHAGPSFTVAAIARGEDGTAGRALATGGDFDQVTAVVLALGARRLAADSDGPGGALTPAQAFDPGWLLDALAGHGVRWERG